MAIGIRWSVVLACPGEGELALLAALSARRDVRKLAVGDPARASLGAELAEIMGLAVLLDRSGGKTKFDYTLEALASVEAASWDPADCPLCKKGEPLTKRGSRQSVA